MKTTLISSKKFKLLILSCLSLAINSLYAQSTQLQGRVDLGPTAQVYKLVTIPNCPQSYVSPTGTATTTVTHETKYTNGKTDIKVESILNPTQTPLIINANKTLRIAMSPNSDGKANFYLDDKDKSIVYVNYWLNKKHVVPMNTKIEEYAPVYDCTGKPTLTLLKTRTLNKKEEFNGHIVDRNSSVTSAVWFLNSNHVKVMDDNGNLKYYIVNRYDRNAKYVLNLENRETLRYTSPSVTLSALTIPIKYRKGYEVSKTNSEGESTVIEVKDDVSSNFNVGVFGGYKLTRHTLENKAGTYAVNANYSFRIGPFISLSTTSLDSLNTTAGAATMKKDAKQNIAVFSTGLGLMLDVKGVQIGVYSGWDFGMGSEAVNWNYDDRLWVGLGVGFKITDLFAPKE